jgi:beta-1,4-mannosyl-glycoprotein beta-1,4-N-acetylglucosaminyltransferase
LRELPQAKCLRASKHGIDGSARFALPAVELLLNTNEISIMENNSKFKKRIFDCFTFFNELEILNIRLRELYDHIDYFVLCESNRTFRGQEKELVFQQNKHLFKQFLDKIIHVVVDDMPVKVDSAWDREHFQRNALRRGLPGDISPVDVIVISDVDEILRATIIQELRAKDGYFMIEMPMYHFFLNTLASENWNKVYAFSHALSASIPDLSEVRTHQLATLEKFGKTGHKITNGGWHFTFIGGAERVRDKLSSYSHAGGAYDAMLEPGAAEKTLITGHKVGGGAEITRIVEIDDTFPTWIMENANYYREIKYIKDIMTRVRELEEVYVNAELKSGHAEKKYRDLLGRLHGLVSSSYMLLKPYSMPEYNNLSFVRENIIPDSRNFDSNKGWVPGTQFIRATPSAAIPCVALQNQVISHVRDNPETKKDNNMGWWHLEGILPKLAYTASCFIWIPATFTGRSAGIFIERFTDISVRAADLNLRDRWQRVWHTATSPFEQTHCNVSLRVDANEGDMVYSTCWQVEVGSSASDYIATGRLELS